MGSGTVVVASLGGTIECVPHPQGGVTPSTDPGYMANVIAGARRDAVGLPEVTALAEPPRMSAALDISQIVSLIHSVESQLDAGGCGAVVTTGTDSLEEVAFLIDLLWGRAEPVVVVGAMRPAGKPGGDGVANLRDGLRVAAHDGARGSGCLVVLDGRVHQAWQVGKRHTSSLSAFESGSGPVGSVVEDTVRMSSASVIDRPLFTLGPSTPLPPVALLTATLGDDGRLLDVVADLGYRGLVVAAMGGGSVPPAWSPPLQRLAAQLPVVYCSRTGGGPTLRSTYGGVGAERDLRRMGMVPAGLLDGIKARLLLGLLLAVDAEQAAMDHVWRMFDAPTTTGARPSFADGVVTTATSIV